MKDVCLWLFLRYPWSSTVLVYTRLIRTELHTFWHTCGGSTQSPWESSSVSPPYGCMWQLIIISTDRMNSVSCLSRVARQITFAQDFIWKITSHCEFGWQRACADKNTHIDSYLKRFKGITCFPECRKLYYMC